MRRAPAFLAIHQDFVDIARIDVADRALDQTGFFVNQRRRHRLHGVLADVVPQPQQILAIALDLGLGALRARRPNDHAHAARDIQLGHDLLETATVRGGRDLAGNAAATRRVRHQHGEAAGERQIGGQRRALGAAFFLDDLDQQDLAPTDDFLDLVVPQEARLLTPFGAIVAAIAVAAHGLRRCDILGNVVGVFVVVFVRPVLLRLGFRFDHAFRRDQQRQSGTRPSLDRLFDCFRGSFLGGFFDVGGRLRVLPQGKQRRY